jgi:hypothetical protein
MTRSEVVREILALKGELVQRCDALVAKLTEAPKPQSNGDSGPDAPQPFTGRPITAKLSGTCAVCGQAIEVGSRIVHNAELKRAAHLGCGAPAVERR